MNAITTTNDGNGDDLIRVLQNSLYPGAKRESVELVVAYCRLNQLDPMLKPVHIVPQNVKVGPEQWETRDTLMPGIGLYRILAARSGEYGGKSEPEFGPLRTEDVGGVTLAFPEWCRVTISRIVQGQARSFSAREFWLENYATAGRKTDAPNAMWRKRAFGQLAKCAEAQALRMAFPEFSGASPTAEEMEGKDAFNGTTIEATPEPLRAAAADMPRAPKVADPAVYEAEKSSSQQNPNTGAVRQQPQRTRGQFLDALSLALNDARSAEEADRIMCSEDSLRAKESFEGPLKVRYDGIIKRALDKWFSEPPDADALPEIVGEEKVGAG